MDNALIREELQETGCNEKMIQEIILAADQYSRLGELYKWRADLLNQIHLYQKKLEILDQFIYVMK